MSVTRLDIQGKGSLELGALSLLEREKANLVEGRGQNEQENLIDSRLQEKQGFQCAVRLRHFGLKKKKGKKCC